MKNIFISHKFTWLSPDQIHSAIDPIKQKLESIWHEVFCSLYHEKDFKQKGMHIDEIYEYCCKVQKQMDLILWLIRSDQDSYGMKIELEQAILDKQDYKLIIDKKINDLEFISKYKQYAQDIFIVDDIYNINKKELDSISDMI